MDDCWLLVRTWEETKTSFMFLENCCYGERVRAGDEMPIDVYDAASWMVISCLTEASIASGGQSIDIPDFTGGRWIMREPEDVTDLA